MKSLTIEWRDGKIIQTAIGFEPFELLGILYYLEQEMKVQLLQAQRGEKTPPK